MSEESTTVVVQRYVDNLAGDNPAEPVIRALLDCAVRRLESLCATMLYKNYARLVQPPLKRIAAAVGATARPAPALGATVSRGRDNFGRSSDGRRPARAAIAR